MDGTPVTSGGVYLVMVTFLYPGMLRGALGRLACFGFLSARVDRNDGFPMVGRRTIRRVGDKLCGAYVGSPSGVSVRVNMFYPCYNRPTPYIHIDIFMGKMRLKLALFCSTS